MTYATWTERARVPLERMRESSNGWYVRAWDGGRDTFVWGIASDSPRYNIGAAATVRIDSVQNVVNPYLGYTSTEDAVDAWTCNVCDLKAFTDGPDLRRGENAARAMRMVEAEPEVRDHAEWLLQTVVDHIEPWWRETRTADALYRADPRWRKFWGPPKELTEQHFNVGCGLVQPVVDVVAGLRHQMRQMM